MINIPSKLWGKKKLPQPVKEHKQKLTSNIILHGENQTLGQDKDVSSHLLFNITLKILPNAMRHEQEIKIIQIEQETIKLVDLQMT